MTDKITTEEFEVCHKFAYDIQFIFPLLDRKFILISHIVSCDEFVIFIDYDNNMTERTKRQGCGWKVHRPLVYDNLKAPSYYDFPDEVKIVITSNQKKKQMVLNMVFEKFKEYLENKKNHFILFKSFEKNTWA